MKRSALVITAAALALSACTQPAQAPTATPLPVTAQPTSTVTPTPPRTPATPGPRTTPGPTARGTSVPSAGKAPKPVSGTDIPGAKGTMPAGFALPHEDRPGDEETTPFTAAAWRAACADGEAVTVPATARVVASRIKQSEGPEHVVGHGLAVFADEASAADFMQQVREGLAGCVAQTAPDDQGFSQVQQVAPAEGLGEEAFAIRTWTTAADRPPVPGSGIQYLSRKGAHVALTYEYGEYVGDPLENRELVGEARGSISAILNQVV